MSDSPVSALVFWASLLGIFYSYIGFPLLVRAAAGRKRVGLPDSAAKPGVMVTVIVPAYNEERHLEARLENLLASAYPRGLLDVIVVSDASTDRTNQIAESFRTEGVRLIVQEMRRGKTAGLNRAVAMARGDILVFTDANASYRPETLRTLVGYLDDPAIGLVTGYTRYSPIDGSDTTAVTNRYTRLECQIKAAESTWGCCVGADGAVFAMRRSLYKPLRDDDINDFVLPLRVIEQGFQCVFAENAFCLESAGQDLESEFRRQSRITSRTLAALWRNRRLLNPLKYPRFAPLLFSHKVVRFLVPLFLVAAAISLIGLVPTFPMLVAASAGLTLVAALPLLLRRLPGVGSRFAGLLLAFLTMNVAIANGWLRFLSGGSDVMWQPHRVRER